jgi:hyperosmotically inducible protein
MTRMMAALVLLAAIGCSRNEGPVVDDNKNNVGAPVEGAADNTERNQRDKAGTTLTATDQAENEADRTITQQIRREVTKTDDLSMNAKNVKIITVDGVVTLRGPVQTAEERKEIGSVAQRVDGVKRVDNQLEIAAK